MAPVKSFWLLMPLLLLRLIPTAAAHPTILNATDIRVNSRTSNVTEAIAWWEKHHAHLPGYFDDIADNFNVSGALKWYKPWIVAKAKEFPKEYENLGEITFFAVKVMGLGTTFKCATLHRGCDGKPTTEAIIEFFMSNDTLSRQEAMEMSRKVNFIFTRTNSAVLQNTATHVCLHMPSRISNRLTHASTT